MIKFVLISVIILLNDMVMSDKIDDNDSGYDEQIMELIDKIRLLEKQANKTTGSDLTQIKSEISNLEKEFALFQTENDKLGSSEEAEPDNPSMQQGDVICSLPGGATDNEEIHSVIKPSKMVF